MVEKNNVNLFAVPESDAAVISARFDQELCVSAKTGAYGLVDMVAEASPEMVFSIAARLPCR